MGQKRVTAYDWYSHYNRQRYYVCSLCDPENLMKGCHATTFRTKEAMFEELDRHKEAGYEFNMSYHLIAEWMKSRKKE